VVWRCVLWLLIPAFLNYITVLDGLSPSVKTSLLRGQFALRFHEMVSSLFLAIFSESQQFSSHLWLHGKFGVPRNMASSAMMVWDSADSFFLWQWPMSFNNLSPLRESWYTPIRFCSVARELKEIRGGRKELNPKQVKIPLNPLMEGINRTS